MQDCLAAVTHKLVSTCKIDSIILCFVHSSHDFRDYEMVWTDGTGPLPVSECVMSP